MAKPPDAAVGSFILYWKSISEALESPSLDVLKKGLEVALVPWFFWGVRAWVGLDDLKDLFQHGDSILFLSARELRADLCQTALQPKIPSSCTFDVPSDSLLHLLIGDQSIDTGDEKLLDLFYHGGSLIRVYTSKKPNQFLYYASVHLLDLKISRWMLCQLPQAVLGPCFAAWLDLLWTLSWNHWLGKQVLLESAFEKVLNMVSVNQHRVTRIPQPASVGLCKSRSWIFLLLSPSGLQWSKTGVLLDALWGKFSSAPQR